MIIIDYAQPVEINDDFSRLYDLINDDSEIIIDHFEKATDSDADKVEYIGNYELTAYIETGNPCADGVYPTVNHTAACNDPLLWHKWIRIKGYGDFYVHDTGGMASNVIDIFVSSYDEAINFGRQCGEVYIIDVD